MEIKYIFIVNGGFLVFMLLGVKKQICITFNHKEKLKIVTVIIVLTRIYRSKNQSITVLTCPELVKLSSFLNNEINIYFQM